MELLAEAYNIQLFLEKVDALIEEPLTEFLFFSNKFYY